MGRTVAAEEFAADRGNRRGVVAIGNDGGQLDDVGDRRPGGVEHGLQVLKGKSCLASGIPGRNEDAVGVLGDLAGDEQEIPGPHALDVSGRPIDPFGIDDFDTGRRHAVPPLLAMTHRVK